MHSYGWQLLFYLIDIISYYLTIIANIQSIVYLHLLNIRTSLKTRIWNNLMKKSILIKVLLIISFCMLYLNTAIAQTSKTSMKHTKQETKDYFPKPKNGGTYVIAHRGAHIGIPENTLAAYKKAIELGCDFVEIDLRKTKDGRFVSVHNSTVDAYTEGKVTGKVGDFTLAELKKLNIGKRIGAEWENERIPTFEEILVLCKGKIGIYLDLKEPDVKAQVRIIKRFGMERDIVWYIPTSHMDVIKEVKKNCDECFVMPDPGPKENIVKLFKEVRPRVIATDMGELNEGYMKIAKKYSMKVFVDEDKGTEKEWKKILSWGTDGIQTNDPEHLIRYLKNRK